MLFHTVSSLRFSEFDLIFKLHFRECKFDPFVLGVSGWTDEFVTSMSTLACDMHRPCMAVESRRH